MSTLDLHRIADLVGRDTLRSSVTIVGLGSGGMPVMQFLAQSGVRRFTLVDHDTLDEANLVKHPARRADLGRPKVDIGREWLLDRNPDAEVTTMAVDIRDLGDEGLQRLCAASDMVVSATDSKPCRYRINDACLATETPMTVGLVHRGGVGGTVVAYLPGESGCFACMEQIAESLDALPSDSEIVTTDAERQIYYGLRDKSFASVGLAADITLVAAVHAQLTLGEILHRENPSGAVVARSPAPWVAVRLRTDSAWSWWIAMLDLPQLTTCVSCGTPVESTMAPTG